MTYLKRSAVAGAAGPRWSGWNRPSPCPRNSPAEFRADEHVHIHGSNRYPMAVALVLVGCIPTLGSHGISQVSNRFLCDSFGPAGLLHQLL